MAYRLPTHIGNFIPPPSEQILSTSARSPASPPSGSATSEVPGTQPWRGSFVVSGLRRSDRESNIEIRVSAVEIDGDCQTHLWPPNLFFSVSTPHGRASPSTITPSVAAEAGQPPTHPSLAHHAQRARQRSISQQTVGPLIRLREFHDWMTAFQRVRTVPMVTFLPERLRDPNANAVNQTNFRNLSRVLWEGQLVAYIPWNIPSPTDPSRPVQSSPEEGGILVYPAQNSSAILTGVVFLYGNLPDFVNAALGIHRGGPGSSDLTLQIPGSSSSYPGQSTSYSQGIISGPPFGTQEVISTSSTYTSTAPQYPYAGAGSSSGYITSPGRVHPRHARHSQSPLTPEQQSPMASISGHRYITAPEDEGDLSISYGSMPSISRRLQPSSHGQMPFGPPGPSWPTSGSRDDRPPYGGGGASSSHQHSG